MNNTDLIAKIRVAKRGWDRWATPDGDIRTKEELVAQNELLEIDILQVCLDEIARLAGTPNQVPEHLAACKETNS